MKFQKSRFLKKTPGIEDTANLVEYDQTRSMKHVKPLSIYEMTNVLWFNHNFL